MKIYQGFANLLLKWFPLVIVGIGISLAPLDTSVNIAFPEITRYFKIPIADIQWVIICYVLTNATLLLGFGRIGDIIGHKKVFIFGLIWSASSFLLCGYASDFKLFLLARGMQGLGAALVMSCAPALATLNFPEKERGKVLGGFYLLFSLALALGPTIGGQLVTHWSWQFVFFFRIPVACLAVILAIFFLKQPILQKTEQSFDWQGWLCLILFLGTLLFALTQGNHWGWLSMQFLGLIGGSVLCFIFFVWQELRCREPILDLRFFGNLGFSLSHLAYVLTITSSFLLFLLLPYYLVTYLNIPASTGGLLLSMAPAGTMISSILGGRLLTKFSPQKLGLTGIIFAAAGLWGVSRLQTDSALVSIITLLFMHGFGVGLFQVTFTDYVMSFLPLHQRGVAGSLTLSMNTIGIVSGAAFGTFIFDKYQSEYSLLLKSKAAAAPDLEEQIFILAFQNVFLWGAALTFLALILLFSGQLKEFSKKSH